MSDGVNRMKKRVLAVCLIVSAHAFAVSEYTTLGVALGMADPAGMPSANEFGDASFVSGDNANTDSAKGAARVMLGYAWLPKEWLEVGVEVGGSYLGQAKYQTTEDTLEYHFYTVDFLVGTRFYAGKKFNVILKAGFANEYTEVSDDNLANEYDSNNSYVPEIATGIGYQFNKSNAISLEYYRTLGTSIDFDNPDNIDNGPTISSGFLAYRYTFA
jgi:hypothetical protein